MADPNQRRDRSLEELVRQTKDNAHSSKEISKSLQSLARSMQTAIETVNNLFVLIAERNGENLPKPPTPRLDPKEIEEMLPPPEDKSWMKTEEAP